MTIEGLAEAPGRGAERLERSTRCQLVSALSFQAAPRGAARPHLTPSTPLPGLLNLGPPPRRQPNLAPHRQNSQKRVSLAASRAEPVPLSSPSFAAGAATAHCTSQQPAQQEKKLRKVKAKQCQGEGKLEEATAGGLRGCPRKAGLETEAPEAVNRTRKQTHPPAPGALRRAARQPAPLRRPELGMEDPFVFSSQRCSSSVPPVS